MISIEKTIYPLPLQLGSKHSESDGTPKFLFIMFKTMWEVNKDSRLISFIVAKRAIKQVKESGINQEVQNLYPLYPFEIKDTAEGHELKLVDDLENELESERKKLRSIYKKLDWGIKVTKVQGFNVYNYKIPPTKQEDYQDLLDQGILSLDWEEEIRRK